MPVYYFLNDNLQLLLIFENKLIISIFLFLCIYLLEIC